MVDPLLEKAEFPLTLHAEHGQMVRDPGWWLSHAAVELLLLLL